ncbi:serine/threonine-protein kinase PCRK1-like [Quercus robur]|uniref:serine/threonine-protein kinase PCRK1-like n=1 Tax=Quercus robur TaxID=38942 RepID=UPI0021630C54|nr:serine/threonine-protein kinase PCRK1-like [Quercus robur]
MERSPGHNLIQFNLSDLEKATKGFKSSYKIGEGDFGAYYRGTIKLSGKSTPVLIQQIQGHVLQAKSDHSWVKELNTIAAMKHQNLLNLVGYCLSGGVRFVVGECTCIGSLSYFLSKLLLSWVKRLIIVQAAARALVYFHDHQIVLRSFKSSSIVIDENLKGKLFDQAVATFAQTEMQNSTPSSGQLDWSFMGFTTPEVDPHNKIKSTDNVYSFGVILLEIITGKPAFDVNRPKNERNLVEWIKSSVSGDETKLAQIMDPNLIGTSGCIKSAMRVLTLSSKCTEEDPKKRPSMSQVLKELAPIVEEYKKIHNEFVLMERQAERDAILCTGVADAIVRLIVALLSG